MDANVQSLCIQHITNEWHKLKPYQPRDKPAIPPPWGVWIRLYDPVLHGDIHDSKSVLKKVWFLDEHGVRERDPWEYARFIVVTWYRPWLHGRTILCEAVWGTTYHEIGLAAFAEFQETTDIYLEMLWGGLWGEGYRMKVTPEGTLETLKRLWIV